MKKIIGFILVGVFVGFFIGDSFRRVFAVQKETAGSLISDHSVKMSDNKEQELLLHAIENLNLKGADLKRAQAYIKKLERNIKRYNWVIAYWKKNGFNSNRRNGESIGPGFSPDPFSVGFFGWDEDMVDKIKNLRKRSLGRMKDFERQSAVRIESIPGEVVYDIPGFPETMKEDYVQALKEIVGKDDMDILSTTIKRGVKHWGENRRLTFSLTTPTGVLASNLKEGVEMKTFSIMVENKDDDASWPFNIKYNIPFRPDSPMFEYNSRSEYDTRWNHLLSWDLFEQKEEF